ncbi:hypothetical protein OC844_007970, partial [Tilletia horrida]
MAFDEDTADKDIEELELEFKILSRQNRLDFLRSEILKKKRQQKISAPQLSVPRASVPRVSVSQTPAPKLSAQPDSESVLRERQNERLRRAGLLPPHANEGREYGTPATATAARYNSVPVTPILTGIDRKIAEIMSSNPRVNAPLVADKSELSRAGIKVSAPEKWKGDRSLQLFTDWVHSVAHYFKVHAPLTETLKVNLLGGYLHGDPLDWYWRHVAPNADQWSAADVVISLRRQFLIDELSRQAADKFEKAEQGSRDVHAFQAYLLKLADQMAEYPSPVALNRRLLNGMKPSVSSAIIANRGIDAELSPWADIVQAAMDQERAM